jgi:hypothetical protein
VRLARKPRSAGSGVVLTIANVCGKPSLRLTAMQIMFYFLPEKEYARLLTLFCNLPQRGDAGKVVSGHSGII